MDYTTMQEQEQTTRADAKPVSAEKSAKSPGRKCECPADSPPLDAILKTAGLTRYAAGLRSRGVTCARYLAAHLDTEAVALGMKIGHRLRLRRHLENELKSNNDANSTVQPRQKRPRRPATRWDFELDRTLRATRFGRVRYGTRRRDGMAVAVKITDYSRVRERPRLEDPLAESSIMSRLGCDDPKKCHPNIVRLIACLPGNRAVWLVQEYANGGEVLGHIVRGKGIGDEKCVRDIFRGVLRGVHHMHANFVAHLDISPENVLLFLPEGAAGRKSGKLNKAVAKLCDFGMAKVSPGGGSPWLLDGATSQPGKSRYMAPEIYAREKYCPFAADIFSLGVVLFVLLTGLAPFCVPAQSDARFAAIYRGGEAAIRALLKVDGTPISDDAASILSYMICDTTRRCTAKELLGHPFLAEPKDTSTDKAQSGTQAGKTTGARTGEAKSNGQGNVKMADDSDPVDEKQQ